MAQKGRNQEFVRLRLTGLKCRACKKKKPLKDFYDVGSRRCKPCDNHRRRARAKRLSDRAVGYMGI